MGNLLFLVLVFWLLPWAMIAAAHRLIASRRFLAMLDKIVGDFIYPFGKP